MDARRVLERPFVDLPMLAMNMKNVQEVREALEAMAERAAMMAAYLAEVDQGHDKAMKAMNRAGRIVHMKVFGYNSFSDLSM